MVLLDDQLFLDSIHYLARCLFAFNSHPSQLLLYGGTVCPTLHDAPNVIIAEDHTPPPLLSAMREALAAAAAGISAATPSLSATASGSSTGSGTRSARAATDTATATAPAPAPPIVSERWIGACVAAGRMLPVRAFLLPL